jgi:hypothetical protein
MSERQQRDVEQDEVCHRKEGFASTKMLTGIRIHHVPLKGSNLNFTGGIMRKKVLPTARRAAVIVAGFLCMGMGSRPCPQAPGSISVTAGHFALAAGAACSQNPSRVVTFTITPARLFGGGGQSTAQTKTELMALQATNLGVDEVGQPIFGCQATTTFSSLDVGEWLVRVSGPVGAGSCEVDVRVGRSSFVKIFAGQCL